MKTITAEEFLKQIVEALGTLWTESDEDICKTFIEFAKIKVTEALKAASENATLTTTKVLWDDPKEGDDAYMDFQVVDKDSILNAYSLDLIK